MAFLKASPTAPELAENDTFLFAMINSTITYSYVSILCSSLGLWLYRRSGEPSRQVCSHVDLVVP